MSAGGHSPRLRAARDLFRLLVRERRCLSCLQPFVPEAPAPRPGLPAINFCPDCRGALPPRTHGHCPACGEPAPWPLLPPALCGNCLRTPPPWSRFIFYAGHEGLLRRLLIRLKFGNRPGLGEALGRLLLERFPPDFQVDAVVPVPLFADRLRLRGYNQALELARPLARHLAPKNGLRARTLRRTRHCAPQTGLSRAGRRANQKDAFAAGPEVAGLRVLLVDDVRTTGATLEAAAHALLRAGAAEVFAAVCGRAPRRG